MRRLKIFMVCARSFPSPLLLVSQQPAQPQALRLQKWMCILKKMRGRDKTFTCPRSDQKYAKMGKNVIFLVKRMTFLSFEHLTMA